jgi:5-methylcytosine-specific restriction endonuclease McrA
MPNQTRIGNIAHKGSKWIRRDKRLAIYLRDGLACVYCGDAMEYGHPCLTLDHVRPQEHGGVNHERNLVCCCRSCNSAKQDKSTKAFIKYLAAKGHDADTVSARIRRNTRRSLIPWRAIAKAILTARKV